MRQEAKVKAFVAKLCLPSPEHFRDEPYWGKFHRHSGFDGIRFETLCGAKIDVFTYLKKTVNAPKKRRCQVCEKSFVADLIRTSGSR